MKKWRNGDALWSSNYLREARRWERTPLKIGSETSLRWVAWCAECTPRSRRLPIVVSLQTECDKLPMKKLQEDCYNAIMGVSIFSILCTKSTILWFRNWYLIFTEGWWPRCWNHLQGRPYCSLHSHDSLLICWSICVHLINMNICLANAIKH